MYNLRPSKSQQPEALLEAHGNMVKHPGGKFRALEAGKTLSPEPQAEPQAASPL